MEVNRKLTGLSAALPYCPPGVTSGIVQLGRVIEIVSGSLK
jgi:hypothetical protein